MDSVLYLSDSNMSAYLPLRLISSFKRSTTAISPKDLRFTEADADPVVMLITQGGDSLLSARRGTLGHGIRRVDKEGWLETHDSTSPT